MKYFKYIKGFFNLGQWLLLKGKNLIGPDMQIANIPKSNFQEATGIAQRTKFRSLLYVYII